MPYIGKSPQHGNFTELTDFSGDFDGSDATHALTESVSGLAITPLMPSAILISINGVIQEPTTDYTVSGTNITFTTAPAATDSFFGVVMGQQLDVGTPSDSTVTSGKLASTFFTGATDIGAAIVDADLFLMDDGAGGTIRKTTASRLKTYIGGSDPASADGDSLGTASLEWSDLYLADGGIIYFGNDQDVTLTHNADTSLTCNLMIAATTFEPTGDTASGDNAAIGYTSGEGLILTGQGSTSDITLKNDADGTVCYVPTGADDLRFPDNAKLELGTGADLQIYHDGSDSYIADGGTGDLKIHGATNVKIQNANGSEVMGNFAADGAVTLYYDNSAKLATASGGVDVTGDLTATGTVEPAGDTASGDNAAIGYTSGEGLILTGQGSTSDITLKNDADATVFHVPTGTTGISFNDNAHIKIGTSNDLTLYHDGSNSYITNAVGALKVATETSGIAITIGHTTSEVTVADNLTVTGTLNATGSILPVNAGGSDLGSTSKEFNDLYLNDAGTIMFGNDQEIRLTHVADTGLILRHHGGGDDKYPALSLETSDTDIAVSDKLGAIYFKAPNEGSGTDAILTAGGIEVVSEGDFSASNNATKMSFLLGLSGAAAEKMQLSSAGALQVDSTLTCTPTSTLLIKDSSGSTLKTVYGVASN